LLTLADRNRPDAYASEDALNKMRLAKLAPGEDVALYRWSSATEPTLTRSELITELAASNPHLLKTDVELIVATVFDRITDALVRGDRVELRGFGAFTVRRRNARIGHNPRTGETVQVDEKTAPHFRAGKELRDRLNHGGMKRHI